MTPSQSEVIASLAAQIAAVEQHKAVPMPYLDSDGKKCVKRAQGLLASRDRSRHELYTRLVDAEFSPSTVGIVVDYLEESGLVNDAQFAAEWVRQRHERRGKGRAVLRQELVAKGIAAGTIEQALSTISDADEHALARTLAAKKAATITALPGDQKAYHGHLRRIGGVLARRGISEGVALSIAREALDARLAELRS